MALPRGVQALLAAAAAGSAILWAAVRRGAGMDTHKLPNILEAALPPHHRATGAGHGAPCNSCLLPPAQTQSSTSWLQGSPVCSAGHGQFPCHRCLPAVIRAPAAHAAVSFCLPLLSRSPRSLPLTLPLNPNFAVTWRHGKFDNPWDTWQERSFSDVLKWNRERRK